MSLFARRKPVSYLAVWIGALLVVLAVILYHFYGSNIAVERRNGQVPQEIYVWQRRWDAAVSKALEQAAYQASGFTVLAAEVGWKGRRVDRVVRVPIDYSTVKAAEKPVGLAFRIGPYSGPFDKRSDATNLLTEIAASLVADAREAGVEPAELQIDFDCAESKLNGYRKWVEALREKIRPVPLTITALPCWLKQRAFKGLARATDGFVLQVHSLERPQGPEAAITLCDSSSAFRWVEQAGRTGVLFRVALPTYGYLIAFDKDGRFIGLSAEGPSRAWDEGTVLRVVRSEPVAMAQLVQRWRHDRPCNMQGVIWYRLPVETDRLNWKWVTLSAIMAGRVPCESLRVEVEYPEPELAEIVLVNDGETDQSARISIKIECGQEKVVASDGLRGYIITRTNSSGICLQYQGEKIFSTIRAGERWKIGWIRFKHEMEVKTHVSAIEP
jgi:hypothetical protein